MDSPRSGSSTVDALWSAVREKPRDLKPRRALAAELTRLGDPLGELITAGLATHDLSDPATREPLEARVRALHEAAKPRGFPKPPWSGGELGFGHVVDHG